MPAPEKAENDQAILVFALVVAAIRIDNGSSGQLE